MHNIWIVKKIIIINNLMKCDIVFMNITLRTITIIICILYYFFKCEYNIFIIKLMRSYLDFKINNDL